MCATFLAAWTPFTVRPISENQEVVHSWQHLARLLSSSDILETPTSEAVDIRSAAAGVEHTFEEE